MHTVYVPTFQDVLLFWKHYIFSVLKELHSVPGKNATFLEMEVFAVVISLQNGKSHGERIGISCDVMNEEQHISLCSLFCKCPLSGIFLLCKYSACVLCHYVLELFPPPPSN